MKGEELMDAGWRNALRVMIDKEMDRRYLAGADQYA